MSGSANAELASVRSDVLGKSPQVQWSVGGIERVLLERYPREDAEDWDRMGILVGDPAARVTGVAIALDATVEAVRAAEAAGANVLLTHHPAFIEPPERVRPLGSGEVGPGTVVWEAVRSGVALINFHTALDVSFDAAQILPGMLGMDFRSIVERVTDDGRGYGQLCVIRPDEAPMRLRTLAARCMAVFGRPGRIWGDMDERIATVVTCTGSAGDLPSHCIQAGCDCLVCGEIRYHAALAAAEAGLAIIELGHDVSELPLCAVLAAALRNAGFPEESITLLDQSDNWNIPEAIRK